MTEDAVNDARAELPDSIRDRVTEADALRAAALRRQFTHLAQASILALGVGLGLIVGLTLSTYDRLHRLLPFVAALSSLGLYALATIRSRARLQMLRRYFSENRERAHRDLLRRHGRPLVRNVPPPRPDEDGA